MNVHFSSQRLDWATPQGVFDELDEEFGFALDVCASPENAKCDRFFEGDEGLEREWWGVCFMNPPYRREIPKWIKKAFDETLAGRATVVALIPSRTDTRWFHSYILPYAINLPPRSEDIAWAAGLIDGEGCVFIKKDVPHPTARQKSVIHNLGLKVSMSDKSTIHRLKNIFHVGHIRHEKRSNSKWKDAWHWTCRSNQAARVLMAIYKYSVTKKEEIFEAIRFSQLPSGRSGKKRTDPTLIEARESLYQKLKELKVDKSNHLIVQTEIRFIKGRLKFGGHKNSAPFPSAIVVFRKGGEKG